MDDGPAIAARLTTRATWRLVMLVLASAGWLICFAILLGFGTWLPFAIVGPALATLVIGFDAATRALLRPSLPRVIVGLAAGLIMVLLTHAVFGLVAPILVDLRATTTQLFGMLNDIGASPAMRAGLIVVVASSEEVIFRGALLGDDLGGRDRLFYPVERGDLRRVIASAAVYGLAMASLGNPLLIACALACGLVWGALRVGTRSLVVPMITHVIWDLGVLVVWPLVP